MTKKDYQAIARAIYKARTEPHGSVLGHIVSKVADVLAADNPSFDRERFIRACETGNMGPIRPVPPCAAVMGCLCAAHARGRKASGPCDARE